MEKTKGAEVLRKLRKINDITLRQVGIRLGISKQTVHKYEQGIARPSPEACDILDRMFGLRRGTFRKLFGRELRGEEDEGDRNEMVGCHDRF
ncbi:MAG TPA: helix-turn-helix transcriptional regulator [Candidatus Methanomethylicus sp.]|jgi:transcriptional regulator with XRE-family HTH domain|nr:helix-turn-helix transcriptional regulator [Candidatus Methanomethylicus sp.]